MKNASVKKSLEKSKNVLEEKRKMTKQKICIKKTNTFTIIAMNFVQEPLKTTKLQLGRPNKALGELQLQNGLRALPAYPVFRTIS